MKVINHKIVILGLCLLCVGKIWAAEEPNAAGHVQPQPQQPQPAAANAQQNPGQQPAAAAGNAAQANGGEQVQNNEGLPELHQRVRDIENIVGTILQLCNDDAQNAQQGGAPNQQLNDMLTQLFGQLHDNLTAVNAIRTRLGDLLPPVPPTALERVVATGANTLAGGALTTSAILLARYLAQPSMLRDTLSGGWWNPRVHTIEHSGSMLLHWFLNHPSGSKDFAIVSGIGAALGLGYSIYKYYYPRR